MSNCEPCTPESTLTSTAPVICPPTQVCAATACVPSSYVCGDWTVTTAADCVVTRTRTSNNMPNGTYTNPTITVVNGCITDIETGTNVLQSRPEPCSTATVTAPTAPTPVVLSALPCNLASFDGGGSLFAGLNFNQSGQNISVAGCGTPGSPFVFSFNASLGALSIATANLTLTNASGAYTLNTSGVNVATGGYAITAGQVRAWTQPITSITGINGVKAITNVGATVLEYDQASALVQNKVLVGVSAGGAFLNPATGVLVPGQAWVQGSAAVYGSRVLVVTPATATIYSAAGAVLGSAPGFTSYGSEAAALVALQAMYTFSS